MNSSLATAADAHIATPRRKSVPAWALSVGGHALALVLIAVLIQSTPTAVVEEPERVVGIVLADDRALEEPENRPQPQQQPGAPAAPASGSPSAAAEPSLPDSSAGAERLLADIPLPGSSDEAHASGPLVQTTSTQGRASKRGLPGLSDAETAAILAGDAALNRPPPPSGPTAQLSLFGGAVAEGRSFVFVIDRSKSMGGSGLGGLAAAESELKAQLALLLPEHEFQIIAYHHKPVYFAREPLTPATDENKGRVGKFFAGLAAFGGTQHRTALFAALRLDPEVVFLLTDGGDPYLSSAELREIQKRAAGRTSIHCVQFGLGPLQEGDPFMRRLAQQNGGGYTYVDMTGRGRDILRP